MTNDTYGRTYVWQFATYDPESHSWRTYPDTGLWGSIPYSETWPKTGCMRDGSAYELPTSVPATSANACSSSLPTPTACPSEHSQSNSQRRIAENTYSASTSDAVLAQLPTPCATDGTKGRTDRNSASAFLPTPLARDGSGRFNAGGNPKLAGAVLGPTERDESYWTSEQLAKLLPTPTVWAGNTGPAENQNRDRDSILTQAVQKLLPTPTVWQQEGKRENQNQNRDSMLNQAVQCLPTPTTQTGGGCGGSGGAPLNEEVRMLPTPTAARLGPTAHQPGIDGIMDLLPTPVTSDATGCSSHEGAGINLQTTIHSLLQSNEDEEPNLFDQAM